MQNSCFSPPSIAVVNLSRRLVTLWFFDSCRQLRHAVYNTRAVVLSLVFSSSAIRRPWNRYPGLFGDLQERRTQSGSSNPWQGNCLRFRNFWELVFCVELNCYAPRARLVDKSRLRCSLSSALLRFCTYESRLSQTNRATPCISGNVL